MSKINELNYCINELRTVSQSLNAVADNLATLFQHSESPTEDESNKEPPEQKEIKLEEVRAVLAEKSRDGHTEQIRELLIKHGADRLSAIDPSKYAALLSDAEELV